MDTNKHVTYEKLNLGEKIFYIGVVNNNIEVAPLQNLAVALKRAKKSLNKEAVLELVRSIFDTSNGKCITNIFLQLIVSHAYHLLFYIVLSNFTL